MTQRSLYVSRSIAAPISEVVLSLDQIPDRVHHEGVALTLDRSPQMPRRGSSDAWRSVAGRMRAARWPTTFGVTVETTPWSDARCELGIRPESRNCTRRETTYCRAAHAIADELRALVLGRVQASAPVVAAAGELVCQIDDLRDLTLVRVAGDLDHTNIRTLRDRVSWLIAAGTSRVRVDLAGLRSIDDAGIAAFVLVTRAVERATPHASLKLSRVPGPIRADIDRSGLAELLAVE